MRGGVGVGGRWSSGTNCKQTHFWHYRSRISKDTEPNHNEYIATFVNYICNQKCYKSSYNPCIYPFLDQWTIYSKILLPGKCVPTCTDRYNFLWKFLLSLLYTIDFINITKLIFNILANLYTRIFITVIINSCFNSRTEYNILTYWIYYNCITI